MPDVRTELERLIAKQQRAQQRLEDVEGEARTAAVAAQAASEAMVEAERRGVRPVERHELEAALSEARARASEPWAERIEGARCGS